MPTQEAIDTIDAQLQISSRSKKRKKEREKAAQLADKKASAIAEVST